MLVALRPDIGRCGPRVTRLPHAEEGTGVGAREEWSERQDLNLRRLGPKPSALARLSYAPTTGNEVSHKTTGAQSQFGAEQSRNPGRGASHSAYARLERWPSHGLKPSCLDPQPPSPFPGVSGPNADGHASRSCRQSALRRQRPNGLHPVKAHWRIGVCHAARRGRAGRRDDSQAAVQPW